MSACKRCGQPVTWGRFRSGKNAPMETDPHGRWVLIPDGGGGLNILRAQPVDDADGRQRWAAHADSCVAWRMGAGL